jgi:hypothetical protein
VVGTTEVIGMRTRGFLFLVGVVSVFALSAFGCTPAESDDDDDGFGTTATPTPTGTGTATPTPTPAGQPITPDSSFVGAGGTEIWLCFEHQFEGSIDNIFTTDGGACELTLNNAGFVSKVEAPTYVALGFFGVTGCVAGDHDWYFDYVEDDDRCTEGCVNQEFNFTQAASATFGSFCGPTGFETVITSLEAYLSQTTSLHRFTAEIGTISTVGIDKMRIYDLGGTAFLTECTATATIVSNGTGLFDAVCNPDPVTEPLVAGTTYSALLFGEAGATPFITRIDFDYVATPAP